MYGAKICFFVDVNFNLPQAVCYNFSFSSASFHVLFQFSSVKFCGVGLKDGRVRDDDIAVSRTRSSSYQKQFARLDRQGTEIHAGGWLGCAKPCGERFSVFTIVSFAHMKTNVQIQFSSNRIFQDININLNRTWGFITSSSLFTEHSLFVMVFRHSYS